jgi:hypothetical protein
MKRRVTLFRLIRSASLPPLSAALLLGAFVGLTPGSADAAKVGRVTLYSVATQEQYVNNADDRARGKGNNPFGNFRDASATATHPTGAPYPGDEVFFKFNVFTSGSLNKSAGSATLSCQYNFNKNAFCDGYYQLDGGTLFGAGPLDFSSSTFALAITGGTGKYLYMTGGIQGSPGPRHSQRLVFTLG